MLRICCVIGLLFLAPSAFAQSGNPYLDGTIAGQSDAQSNFDTRTWPTDILPERNSGIPETSALPGVRAFEDNARQWREGYRAGYEQQQWFNRRREEIYLDGR